jgi:4-carboxymuconolactone decarboxylase
VKPQTIKDIQAGRTPKQAAKDELAIIDFVKECTRPGGSATKPTSACTPSSATPASVELVGICGYYAMISMTLNVFRAQIPEDAPLPFAEPAV